MTPTPTQVIEHHVEVASAMHERVMVLQGWRRDQAAANAAALAWRDALHVAVACMPLARGASAAQVAAVRDAFGARPGASLPDSDADVAAFAAGTWAQYRDGHLPDYLTRVIDLARQGAPVRGTEQWLASAGAAGMAALAFDGEISDDDVTSLRALFDRWADRLRGEGVSVSSGLDVMAAFERVVGHRGSTAAVAARLAGPPPTAVGHGDGRVDGESLAVPLRTLGAMVGLRPVKNEVRDLIALAQVRQLRAGAGLAVEAMSQHLAFVGNPGTGKTSVARLLASAYAALGVLSRGHLVEVSRSDLVGRYVGHTAPRTEEAFRSAVGGVLFVDEAYGLARDAGPAGSAGTAGQDFGAEAVTSLVKLMEDHRRDIVVILAGHPTPMHALLGSNPGLRSRLKRAVFFPDLSSDELGEVFRRMCASGQWTLEPGCVEHAAQVLGSVPRTDSFGNARECRRLYEATVTAHARRVAPTGTRDPFTLSHLSVADVEAGADRAFGPSTVRARPPGTPLSEHPGHRAPWQPRHAHPDWR